MKCRYSFKSSTKQWTKTMVIPILTLATSVGLMTALTGCNFTGQGASNGDNSSGSNFTGSHGNGDGDNGGGMGAGRTNLTGKTIRFSSLSASQSEGDTTVVVATVELGEPLDSPLTIPITLGGTAGEGSDVRMINPPVIPAGEISVNIPIQIIDDNQDERDETVIVSLRTPSGAEVDSANATFTLTIVDDDLAEDEKNPSGQYPALQLITDQVPQDLQPDEIATFPVGVKIHNNFPMARSIESVELIRLGGVVDSFVSLDSEDCSGTLLTKSFSSTSSESTECNVNLTYDSGGAYSLNNYIALRVTSRTRHNGEDLDETIQIQDLQFNLKMEQKKLFLVSTREYGDTVAVAITRNPEIQSYVSSDRLHGGSATIYDAYLSGTFTQRNNGLEYRTSGVFQAPQWHDCNRTNVNNVFDQGVTLNPGESCVFAVEVDENASGSHTSGITLTYTTPYYGATRFFENAIQIDR